MGNVSRNVSTIFGCTIKFRWYFFAPLHRSCVELFHQYLTEIFVVPISLSFFRNENIVVLFCETYFVVGYNNRGRKQGSLCKIQYSRNLDHGVKRARKEVVNDFSRKVRLVKQQSKYHKERYIKINNVIIHDQGLFT